MTTIVTATGICCDRAFPSLTCSSCKASHHLTCLTKEWKNPPLLGDLLYRINACASCSSLSLARLSLAWTDVIEISLYNLSSSKESKFTIERDGYLLKFYHIKQDLSDFIDRNWGLFWTRAKHSTWRNSVASCLSTTSKFVSAQSCGMDQSAWTGLWALTAPFNIDHTKLRAISHTITDDGSLVEVPSTTQDRKRQTTIDDESTNTKKRSRREAIPPMPLNPEHTLQVYCDIPNPASKPKLSTHPTHTAPQLKISGNGYTVSNSNGYRMCKATHGVVTGKWYYEVMVMNAKCNARIGWAQISGDLQAPCGYDSFSYSWRQRPGTLFHMSDASEGVDHKFGYGYDAGDVIGVCISLPELTEAEELDLISREWDMESNSQYLPYKRGEIKRVIGSEILYYKNGVKIGVAFSDMGLGKYHPALSVYGYGSEVGSAQVNFGPEFRFPIPNGFLGLNDSSGIEKRRNVKLEGAPSPVEAISRIDLSASPEVVTDDFKVAGCSDSHLSGKYCGTARHFIASPREGAQKNIPESDAAKLDGIDFAKESLPSMVKEVSIDDCSNCTLIENVDKVPHEEDTVDVQATGGISSKVSKDSKITEDSAAKSMEDLISISDV